MSTKKVLQKNGNGSGRVKFRYADDDRYMDIDVEAAPDAVEAVAQGLKSIASALSGRMLTNAPIRTLSTSKAGAGTAIAEPPQTEIEFPPAGNNQDVGEEIDENSTDETATVRETDRQKRSYSFRAPKFLDHLDLSTATKPLAEFIGEKGSPIEMSERYIAVAVWLKEHLQVEEFTIHHIYTAFDNLGWKAQMPVDHSQPLRDLKNKRHFLTKEKGAGYKVNWQGIQYVAKMGAAKA